MYVCTDILYNTRLEIFRGPARCGEREREREGLKIQFRGVRSVRVCACYCTGGLVKGRWEIMAAQLGTCRLRDSDNPCAHIHTYIYIHIHTDYTDIYIYITYDSHQKKVCIIRIVWYNMDTMKSAGRESFIFGCYSSIREQANKLLRAPPCLIV